MDRTEVSRAASTMAKARLAMLKPEEVRKLCSDAAKAFWSRLTPGQRAEIMRARVKKRRFRAKRTG